MMSGPNPRPRYPQTPKGNGASPPFPSALEVGTYVAARCAHVHRPIYWDGINYVLRKTQEQFLERFGYPCFSDPFEDWGERWGFVMPCIYYRFFWWGRIRIAYAKNYLPLNKTERAVIDGVICKYLDIEEDAWSQKYDYSYY